MKVERMLPENFDGVVRFTNWTDEDFVGKWNSREYHFKAGTTSPLLMVDQTPLDQLNICKKFAMDLAVREFGKSEAYKNLLKQERNADGTPRNSGIHGAGTYSIDQLTPLIQKCLYIYPASRATVSDAMREKLEDKLTRDEEGKINTKAVKKSASMKELASTFEE